MAASTVISQNSKVEGETRQTGETFEDAVDIISNIKRSQNLGNIQHVARKLLKVSILQIIFASLELFCLEEKHHELPTVKLVSLI